MGSIASRPKAPPVVVDNSAIITPQPTPIKPPEPIEPSPEEIAKTRVENILRRSRSALGNVYTSFRGVLGGNGNAPQRKSLLGE